MWLHLVALGILCALQPVINLVFSNFPDGQVVVAVVHPTVIIGTMSMTLALVRELSVGLSTSAGTRRAP